MQSETHLNNLRPNFFIFSNYCPNFFIHTFLFLSTFVLIQVPDCITFRRQRFRISKNSKTQPRNYQKIIFSVFDKCHFFNLFHRLQIKYICIPTYRVFCDCVRKSHFLEFSKHYLQSS